jgi:periodic tryptophan protein 2
MSERCVCVVYLCYSNEQMTSSPNVSSFLSKLNSKNMADGGPTNTGSISDNAMDVTTYNALQLPGAQRGDDGSLLSKNIEIRTLQVVFSYTGLEFSVVSGEGLLIYRLDDDFIFDPILMNETITPASIEQKLSSREYSMALRMALNLNEPYIIQMVLENVPFQSISFVCRSISFDNSLSIQQQPLEILLQSIARMIDESPHIEFYLQWSLELLQIYGFHVERYRNRYMRALRVLHKAVLSKRMDFYGFCIENKYMLDFIECHALLMQQQQDAE